MADNLRTALGEVFVELIALTQAVSTNADPDVAQAIESQKQFFALVQKRTAELSADVTAAKKRLGTGRHSAWAGEMIAQAAQDVRDGAMGRSAADAQAIEAVAQTIESLGPQAQALTKLP